MTSNPNSVKSQTTNSKNNSNVESTEEKKTKFDHSVRNVVVKDLTEPSKYVITKSMSFEQNGKKRRWHLVEAYDCVAGIAFDKDKSSFLLVKQFRPAVFYSNLKRKLKETNANGNVNKNKNKNENNKIAINDTNSDDYKDIEGCTYELCAGLLDKPNLNEKETLKEEFLEEIGYNVPLDNIEKIAQYSMHTGLIGNKCTIFCAFINDKMKQNKGGGVDNEYIQLYWLPLKESRQFILNPNNNIPPGLQFALFWFYNKYPQLCKDTQ